MFDELDIPQDISREKQMRMAAKWLTTPPVPRHKPPAPEPSTTVPPTVLAARPAPGAASPPVWAKVDLMNVRADIAETERRMRYGVSHPGDDYRLRALRLREASLAATRVDNVPLPKPTIDEGRIGPGSYPTGRGVRPAIDAYMATQFANAWGGTGAYSPDRFGWHDYVAGPHMAASNAFNLPQSVVRSEASRAGVPGQDPSEPIRSREAYVAYDPRYGFPVGRVRSTISPDGLTITNETEFPHLLQDGNVVRRFMRAPDGSWYVATRGVGNNVIPLMNVLNEWQGPKVFRHMDDAMRDRIERRYRNR